MESIRGKIIIAYIVFIVLPVLLLFSFYSKSSVRVMEDQVHQSNQELVDRAAESMNALAERMVKASYLLTYDTDIIGYFRSDVDWISNYTSFERLKNAQGKLYNVQNILLDQDAEVALIDFRGYVLSANSSSNDMKANYAAYPNATWFEETKTLNGWPNWFIQNGKQLVMTCLILQQSGNYGYGIIYIAIPLKEPIQQWYDGTSHLASGWYIMDDTSQEATLLEQNKEYLVNTAAIPQISKKIIKTSPTQFSDQLKQIKSQSFLWILFWVGLLELLRDKY